MDVYESKRTDIWGQIIKAQYKEDQDNKIVKKMDREKKNHGVWLCDFYSLTPY